MPYVCLHRVFRFRSLPTVWACLGSARSLAKVKQYAICRYGGRPPEPSGPPHGSRRREAFQGATEPEGSDSFWPVAFIALNLPPHLRMRPGLMLPATIIPGPQVSQLQGGISPNIDEIAYGQQHGFQLRDAAWTPADLPLQQDFLCRLSLGGIGGDYRGVVKIELNLSAPAHKYACLHCEAEGFSIGLITSIFPGALRLLTRSNPMRALLRTINRPMAGPPSAPGPPVPAVSAAVAKELQPPPAATNEAGGVSARATTSTSSCRPGGLARSRRRSSIPSTACSMRSWAQPGRRQTASPMT